MSRAAQAASCLLRTASPRLFAAAGLVLGALGPSAVTPVVLASPAELPDVRAAAAAATAPACSGSLQPLLDAASPGSTVVLPACVARETLTIDKPLTVVGQVGAEIRGSDVWSAWRQQGGTWVSTSSLPAWPASSNHDGRCAESTTRCLLPEQVFVDGRALYPVGTGKQPGSGQFALDAARHVVLADDPTGHTVEVSTRRAWILTRSDGVSIQNMIMRHAANDPQRGGLSNDGHSNWSVQDSVLSDAHGAVVSIHDGSNLNVLRNDVSRGGDLGIHGTAVNGALVQGNRIHDNAIDQFNPEWEAGGLKITASRHLSLDHNEVDGNAGVGLWCDIACADVTYSNNRVHDNRWQGILFEVSNGASIHDNTVWQNGRSRPFWGWGAGILISSSANAEVYNNAVAWNYAGISVIAQQRPDLVTPVGNYVHDNTIVRQTVDGDASKAYWQNLSLAWLSDGVDALYDPASNNRGANNRYWYDQPESDRVRATWDHQFAHIADLGTTPGDRGASYLSDDDKNSVLGSLAMPASPSA